MESKVVICGVGALGISQDYCEEVVYVSYEFSFFFIMISPDNNTITYQLLILCDLFLSYLEELLKVKILEFLL